MKKITTRFEYDPSLDCIEVVIRASEKEDLVSELIERFSDLPANTILTYDDNGYYQTLPAEDILSVSVFKTELTIVAEQGTFYSRRSLQSLEAELDPELFIRISRYELINIKKVRRYDFSLPGTLRIELINGTETWASRRSIPLIRRRLMGKEGKS